MIPEHDQHLAKAIHNLSVLRQLECAGSPYRDWQVTVCFYVALHLTRYHLWQTIGQGYESHSTAENAMQPANNLSVARIEEKPFGDYLNLSTLSRRSRYLFDKGVPFATNDRTYRNTLVSLDRVMRYFASTYKLDLPTTLVKCPMIMGLELAYFKHQLT